MSAVGSPGRLCKGHPRSLMSLAHGCRDAYARIEDFVTSVEGSRWATQRQMLTFVNPFTPHIRVDADAPRQPTLVTQPSRIFPISVQCSGRGSVDQRNGAQISIIPSQVLQYAVARIEANRMMSHALSVPGCVRRLSCVDARL
jgi:hypothetical protein